MRIADVLRAKFFMTWMSLFTVVLTSEVLSCGIDWRLPQSHFEGVDEQGHVLYCEKIGTLDMGDGLDIPLHIMFKSEWMANSPFLGKGWMLPLLQSRIEQTSERSFRLWQPDGWYRDFWCSKSSELILDGQGGWKAETRGDTTTAWAPCGWKLVFKNKKLATIVTPKNRHIDLVSKNGQVDEVLANGLSVLRVDRDTTTGRVKGLTLHGGKRIAIEQKLRPRIEHELVKGEDYSLAKLTLVDGAVRTYEYEVDEQWRPTLKMGDRLIVWDPVSNLIVKNGQWMYDIKADSKNPMANAAIERKNSNGESEFWHYDGSNGREIVQGIDGVKKVSTWFLSGKLTGKIRESRDYSSSGDLIQHQRWSYNENGSLLRKQVNDLVIEKDFSGRIVVRKGDEIVYKLAAQSK